MGAGAGSPFLIVSIRQLLLKYMSLRWLLWILLSKVKFLWVLLPCLTFFFLRILRTAVCKYAWNEHSLISLESLEILLLLGASHNVLMKILSWHIQYNEMCFVGLRKIGLWAEAVFWSCKSLMSDPWKGWLPERKFEGFWFLYHESWHKLHLLTHVILHGDAVMWSYV